MYTSVRGGAPLAQWLQTLLPPQEPSRIAGGQRDSALKCQQAALAFSRTERNSPLDHQTQKMKQMGINVS